MDSNNQNTDSVSKSEEKRLFSKIKKRDQEAFIRAYDLYADQIYRFVFFKVNDSEEAQDLTSAIFLKTWNYIQENSISDFKTLRALIYKVARTTVIDHYRKQSQVNNLTIDNPEEKIDIVDESVNIIEELKLADDMELIKAKLGELKEEYREIIILRYIDDLSIAEISKVIDKSKGNVRVIVSRAMKALRELMETLEEQNK